MENRMVNTRRLEMQELVSSNFPAEATKCPCQGSTLCLTLPVRKSQSDTRSVLSLTGSPMYVMGKFPSFQ
jgi:hypothetical protein